MKDGLNALYERRSVRKYKSEQISDSELEQILKAGLCAPSAMNRQPAIIIAVQDKDTIAYMSKLNAQVMGANGDPFYGAPTVCVVFADTSVGTWVEDGSLVIGNMLAAAHSLGVGSCWIHRARQEFELPEGKALMQKWGVDARYAGVGHCILGYAAAEPAPAKARKADFIVRV